MEKGESEGEAGREGGRRGEQCSCSKPTEMSSPNKSITYIAASMGQRGNLTGQMPKLAGKSPVTDCYHEHWESV